MARLEDVLPALRAGKKIEINGVTYWINSLGNLEPYSACEFNGTDLLSDDWEIVPSPTRVADYLVRYYGHSDIYIKQTHPIGQQPEGSIMVPGSERSQT